MKKAKLILLGFLALSMVACGSVENYQPSSVTQSEKNTEANTEANTEGDTVTSQSTQTMEDWVNALSTLPEDQNYLQVIYLDNDDIPEVIGSNGNLDHHDTIQVFKLIDNAFVYIGDMPGCCSASGYIPFQGLMYGEDSAFDAGYSEAKVYDENQQKLVTTFSGTYYDPGYVEEEGKADTYEINEVRVSEEVFETKLSEALVHPKDAYVHIDLETWGVSRSEFISNMKNAY